MISSVFVIGKQNNPLFSFCDIDATQESLFQQTIALASIDIVEEKKKRFYNAPPGTQDLYLGQLLTISDYKVFGMCSNTNVKVVAVCDINMFESQNVRDLLLAVYSCFINSVQNPFSDLGEGSKSKILRSSIQILLQKFNNSVPSILNSKLK